MIQVRPNAGELRSWLRPGRTGRRILSVGTMRAGSVALAAVQVLVLSRVLGASGLGSFAIITTWLLVLTTLSVGGFGRLVQRSIGKGGAEAAQSVRTALRTTSIIGCIAALLVLVIGTRVPGTDHGVIAALSLMVALSVPLFVLTATLAGLGSVGMALMPDVLAAILVIGCTLLASVAMAQVPVIVPISALLAAVIGSLIVCALAVARRIPLAGTWRRAGHPRAWDQFRDVRVLGAISAIAMLTPSIPLIFIGLLSSDEQAGYYAIAAKLGMLVMLPLQVVGLASLSELSASAQSPAVGPLIEVYRRTRRLSGLGSLLIAVVMLLALPLILHIFGASNRETAIAAAIVILAQVANSAAGAVAFSLMMLHRESVVLRWLIVSLIASVTISLIFVAQFGAIAGACATAASLVIWNLALVLVLRSLARPDGWTVTRVAEA